MRYTRTTKSPAPAKAVCRIFVFPTFHDILESMQGMERTTIYVDGGNFYHLVLKKLGADETRFDLDGFARFLTNGRLITPQGKRYYIGTVREKIGDLRSKNAMARQTKFLTTLQKNAWEIKTSKLRRRMERIVIDNRVIGFAELRAKGITEIVYERQREKGIDVKLATDLLVGAVDDRYDTALIVSSDADLVPAMDWVRLRRRKKIEYIGFSLQNERFGPTRPLQTMIAQSDIQRILVAADLERFVRPGVDEEARQ